MMLISEILTIRIFLISIIILLVNILPVTTTVAVRLCIRYETTSTVNRFHGYPVSMCVEGSDRPVE